ncbi:MAG: hypothetical protein AAF603_00590 [Pseudomonadota bacterium]
MKQALWVCTVYLIFAQMNFGYAKDYPSFPPHPLMDNGAFVAFSVIVIDDIQTAILIDDDKGPCKQGQIVYAPSYEWTLDLKLQQNNFCANKKIMTGGDQILLHFSATQQQKLWLSIAQTISWIEIDKKWIALILFTQARYDLFAHYHHMSDHMMILNLQDGR